MDKEFVPFDLSLIMRDKGFDEKTFGFYWMDTKQLVYDTPNYGKHNGCHLQAPLQQQAINWFSEVHNIEIEILRYTYNGGKYQGKVYMWMVDQYDPKYNHELEENPDHWVLNQRKSQGYDFKNKIDAINEAIKEALTLI